MRRAASSPAESRTGESVTYMAITGEMPERGASFRERSLAAC